ncbi:MAG: nucleotidyltransferase family protein [bacterium]
MTALILAGGLGTRLRETVPDLPKPMAPVAGRPFLEHLLDAIEPYVTSVVLSIGYRAEAISNHFGSKYRSLAVRYCYEDQPLGTGGAVKLALDQGLVHGQPFFLLNGDTLFTVDLAELAKDRELNNSVCSVALAKMTEPERYGAVELSGDGQISRFFEKGQEVTGLINGGVYAMASNVFEGVDLPQKFSFERDFLEPAVEQGKIRGKVFEGFFIDIGVPSDFARANRELGPG